MPTLYWGPRLAKIRRGGPDNCVNKMRGEGVKKCLFLYCHTQGIKTVHAGGGG